MNTTVVLFSFTRRASTWASTRSRTRVKCDPPGRLEELLPHRWQAARQAPAAYIGPTQYSQMIWAILLGYVLFGDGVDLPMVAGIVLIVASGLLTLMRENVRGTPLPPSVAGERHVAAALVPEAVQASSQR